VRNFPHSCLGLGRIVGCVGVERILVLIVDDHALHRDGTRRILEQYSDIEVIGEAESGELALALINQLHPSIVLMDIGLPGINGIETTRRIRERHPDVRVLVITAYEEDEYVRGALEAGAAGYLSKTAPGRELVEAVRAVAAGATVLQSGLLASILVGRASSVEGLTERELTILQLLATGSLNKQIASQLGISTRTVERHCDHIYAKLGVKSRTEAVVHGIGAKFIRVPDVRH
jgi:DNA-binding NarL/FixJ family response regulator